MRVCSHSVMSSSKWCNIFPLYNTVGRVFSGTLCTLKMIYKKSIVSSFHNRFVWRNFHFSLFSASGWVFIHFRSSFYNEVAKYAADAGLRRWYVHASLRWSLMEIRKYSLESISPGTRPLSVWTTITCGFFLIHTIVRNWCGRRLWRIGWNHNLGSKAF